MVARPGAASNQRRGGLLILGVVLVVGAAFGFWIVFASINERQAYVVAARTIERWEVVAPGDLTTIEANVGTASALPADEIDSVVGRWATGRIPEGTLVSGGLFDTPPLSSEFEARQVLIEVTLPQEEAPSGTLQSGDTIALLGSAASGLEGEQGPTELIGKLTLDFVSDAGTAMYLVTPAVALSIEDTVRRYTSASDRRIWKLGRDVTAEELTGVLNAAYGNLPAAAPDAFASVGVGAEPIEDLS